jgi:hypothetical protein
MFDDIQSLMDGGTIFVGRAARRFEEVVIGVQKSFELREHFLMLRQFRGIVMMAADKISFRHDDLPLPGFAGRESP